MSIEERSSGIACVPDDAYNKRRTHSSLPPGSRTSLSVLTTLNSSAVPDIPKRGTGAIVFRAAEEVTRIFREAGYAFVIFGSMACYLYGNERLPNDIDIVILSHTCDLDFLKRLLVNYNPINFELMDAKTPGARCKILTYQIYINGKLEKTKVDILKPGFLNLPMIFSEAIVDKQGLPVVPISILLLHKLQGWTDNVESDFIPRLGTRWDADGKDICSLLEIIVEGMDLEERENSTHWKQFALERFDEEFRGDTERRVRLFCLMYPQYRQMWKKLGW
ncbi:hypothetical protein EDD18DRAFT_1079691 [Armillaria luteobubalina]|uniref:Nucleotidyltransferase n=1 Tax=Armillaria luteobubalina TaxID=153913 RepID=A0AA39PZ37_9AGAR|nr:hypothetical protein EDD18DRAFT_1079691 [Armillaria luteobubalina]